MSWVDRNLLSEFKRSADDERAWQAQRDRRRDREREDTKSDKAAADENDLLSAVEQAAQLREIEERLDALEVQVTQALIENDRRLDEVNLQIETLLSQAFVLPDGRRVFKTEDGTQVFDEHGEEVTADIVSPDDIPDDNPTWETYQEFNEEKADLLQEREQLLDLQQDIDAARENAENGELDMGELDALEAEFGEINEIPSIAAQTVVEPDPKIHQVEVATKDTTAKFQF